MTEMEDLYRGMSVNERLFAAGLLSDFDDEVRSGNRKRMIELLDRVHLARQSAWIVDSILSHPTRSGRMSFGF
jgi:hypothetical protein